MAHHKVSGAEERLRWLAAEHDRIARECRADSRVVKHDTSRETLLAGADRNEARADAEREMADDLAAAVAARIIQ